MKKSDDFAAIDAITRLVRLSSRYSWPVILGFLLVAIFSVDYFTRHFVITTDSNKLLSSSLPWRQQEVMLDLAFPQRIDRIIAVIDATTPEAADNAADALVNELSPRSDAIRTVSRPDGGEFFERNGILFLTLDEVRRNTAELISAQPFLGTLAADPTLRGVFRALSQSLEGVRLGKAKLDDLQPGGKATAVIRDAASRLGLTPEKGVKVRLTGSVALADEEFATVADGAAENGLVTLFLVGLVLWLALKKARIILVV